MTASKLAAKICDVFCEADPHKYPAGTDGSALQSRVSYIENGLIQGGDPLKRTMDTLLRYYDDAKDPQIREKISNVMYEISEFPNPLIKDTVSASIIMLRRRSE